MSWKFGSNYDFYNISHVFIYFTSIYRKQTPLYTTVTCTLMHEMADSYFCSTWNCGDFTTIKYQLKKDVFLMNEDRQKNVHAGLSVLNRSYCVKNIFNLQIVTKVKSVESVHMITLFNSNKWSTATKTKTK